jgi:hypothetical protein
MKPQWSNASERGLKDTSGPAAFVKTECALLMSLIKRDDGASGLTTL